MKRRDVEKKLRELGWSFLRSGGDHDIWSNGSAIEPIPRHKEINEYLAKGVLKRAKAANLAKAKELEAEAKEGKK